MLREAVDRTAAWAARARVHHARLEAKPPGQALFGIVQGGTDADLRAESARRTVDLDFDGYAIGGLSVGEPRPAMLEALAATLPHLPVDRPRYLMGVGDPVGIGGGGGARGRPVRLCGSHPYGPPRGDPHRHRTAQPPECLHGGDDGPLDPDCSCSTCARWSRGYLRHLLGVGEPTAWRLLSLHNLAFVLGMMTEARSAIAEGRFEAFRSRIDKAWSA